MYRNSPISSVSLTYLCFLCRQMEQMNPSILDAGAHTSDNHFYPLPIAHCRHSPPHPTPSPVDSGFTLSYTAPCNNHAHASDRHHIGLTAKVSAATPRHRSEPRKHRGLGRVPPNPPGSENKNKKTLQRPNQQIPSRLCKWISPISPRFVK